MNKTKSQIIDAFLNESKKAQFALKQKETALFERYPELAELEDRFKTAGIAYTKNKIQGAKDAETVYQAAIEDYQHEKQTLYQKYQIPSDYLEPVYQCEKCHDTGYIDGELCQCLKKRIDEVCFSQYDLKPEAQNDTFDQFDLNLYPEEYQQQYKSILGLCKSFCTDFDHTTNNYYFYGDPGLGKTFLCNCIVNALEPSKHNIIYITAPHLLESIKANLRDDHSERALIDALKQCDLLIIDDLGTEYATEYNQTQLFDLINDRLMAKKPMIISSNLNPQELNARYSPRLYSRIGGNFRLIPFRGEDIRFKKKRQRS